MEEIFREIAAERERQDARWGEQNHAIRHDDESRDHEIDALFAKSRCDTRMALGKVAWSDILLEEVYEALAEGKDKDQRRELIQVAAVAVSMIQCIDRKAARAGTVTCLTCARRRQCTVCKDCDWCADYKKEERR